MITETPEIQQLTEKHVAYVTYIGNYIGNPAIFKELFNKLCGWAGPKGIITPQSQFLSSYCDDPSVTPPDELKLELCITAPTDVTVEGDIQKQVLPGGKYAVMHAELSGPDEYGTAWCKIVEWITGNNMEVDMSRPSYELYLNNPEEHPENHHIIDICLSII